MIPIGITRLYMLMLDGAKIISSNKVGNVHIFNITLPRCDSDEDNNIHFQLERYHRCGWKTEIILGTDTKEFYKWIYDNRYEK